MMTLIAATATNIVKAQSINTDETNDTAVIKLDPFTVRSDEDNGYIAEQSISGSRFVTDPKDFPFSLQVITGDFLKDIAVEGLPDVLNYVTGTLGAQANQAPEVSVVQRGYVTTLQLRDGVRKPGGFDVAGSERIEIVNGPSSVLFGITNPGGTINTLSKKPVKRPLAEFAQTIGSWEKSRTVVDVGGPLNQSASLAFRLPMAYTTSDGYYVNSNSRKAYAAPVFAWDVTENTKLEVGVEVVKNDYIPVTSLLNDLDNGELQFSLPRNFNGNTGKMYTHQTTVLPSFSWTQRIGQNWTLRSNSSFYNNDYEALYANRGAVRASQNYAYPRNSEQKFTSDRTFQHNTDLVLTSDVSGGTLTMIAGFEIRDAFNRSHWLRSNPSPPSWLLRDPSTWNYGEDNISTLATIVRSTTDFRSSAYSLLAQYISDDERLIVSGGIRYDSTESVSTNLLSTAVPGEYDADEVTAQIGGLYWLKQDAFAVYANYSSSFEPILRTLVDVNFNPFTPVPVSGRGIEIGFRNVLRGGKFIHSVAFYRVEQENLPISLLRESTSSTVSFYDAQGGVHRSEGIEYNFNCAIGSNWALFGGVSYNDARVASDDTPTANNTLGQRLPHAFRYKANAFVKYTFDGGLYIGAGGMVVGDAPQQLGAFNSVLTNPGYTAVNLLGGYSWEAYNQRWSLQVNVNNLTNDDYVYMRSITRSLPTNVDATLRVKF